MTDSLASRAIGLTHRLQSLLEQEFDALRRREPQTVEDLQAHKTTLLAQIRQLMEAAGALPGAPVPPGWEGFGAEAARCRDLHQRNAALVDRQLAVVRGALHALRDGDPAIPDMYDRRQRRRAPSSPWVGEVSA